MPMAVSATRVATSSTSACRTSGARQSRCARSTLRCAKSSAQATGILGSAASYSQLGSQSRAANSASLSVDPYASGEKERNSAKTAMMTHA